ncbi:hypothetical protein Agub_g10921, partial [Astrephomene gubernaculifera]
GEGQEAEKAEGGGGGAGVMAAAAAEEEVDSGALPLPPHVYYLAGNRLMKYALVTRSSGALAQLPTDTPRGDVRTPRQLLHSTKAAAWLVFFETPAAAGAAGGADGGGSAAAAAAAERFTWTLLNGSSFGAASASAGGVSGGGGAVEGCLWVRSGKSGCFLGPADERFCVMAAAGRLLEVYDTAAAAAVVHAGGGLAAPTPLLSVALEGSVLLPGLGAPVFPGPPMTNAPVPEARAPPEAAPHDLRRFRGSGVVLWQSPDHCLSMATLPELARVPLEAPPPQPNTPPAAAAAAGYDSSDDDTDAAAAAASQPYYPTLAPGHHFGSQPRQASLPLLPSENVVHVAWQSLALAPPRDQANGSSSSSGGGGGGVPGPADAVAAVLTTQRLLLVTAGLRVVCAVSLVTHGSAALLDPLTSVVWAGPMLLVSTVAGQVLQLTWTGTLLPVATLSPTGHCALLGVTADALILLRTPLGAPPVIATASGNAAALAEAVVRPAALLQPLLIGWASLAATGLLSYGPAAAVVRPALRHALSTFDTASLTPRGVWALIAAGAWDVAAAVAAHLPALDGAAAKLAVSAAAGNWSAVAATLRGEASRSLYAPGPPLRGSELHSKLVAAAAGALFHGQLAVAGELFQAAGEWAAAMILAVCQGNVQAVSAVAQQLAGTAGGLGAAAASADAAAAAQLAVALRGVYGGVGTPVEDLTLSLLPPGGPGAAPIERAEQWPLAAPLTASPAAVAVRGALPHAAATDAEVGDIPPCHDRTNIVSYYGLTTAAATAVAAAAGAVGARTSFASIAGGDRGESASHRPGGSTAHGELDTTSVSSSDAAQAAARAEFMNQMGAGMTGFGRGPTIAFSSDEDSDSEATGSVGGGSCAGGPQRRIKIQIRDRGSAGSGAVNAGGGGGASGDVSLREAARGLRLAPPGAAAAAAGGTGAVGSPLSRLALGSTASGPIASAGPSGNLSPAPSAPTSGAAAGYPFPPGMSSVHLYTAGVSLMQSGDWRGAAAHFARAMWALSHEERTSMDDASRRARLAFCASYYAAVRLLEGVGAGAGPREARLYRYLAGLKLDTAHARALLREAITRNRTVGNYKYAADQLTALIGLVADTAPGEHLAQLQAELEECDRHGPRNADLPADEDVSDWVALVAAAGQGDVG